MMSKDYMQGTLYVFINDLAVCIGLHYGKIMILYRLLGGMHRDTIICFC